MAEFDGLIYVFHRAAESADIHYRTSPDGRGWSDGRSLADRAGGRTGDQPVVVAFGGRLFVLWRGAADDAHLEVCSTDGWTWAKSARLGRGESVRTSTRPAPVVFGGRLYVFFRGESATSTLYVVSTVNGRDWSHPVNVTEATRGARSAGPPFPVLFDGQLVVLVRDPANSRIGVCRTADGTNWSGYGTVAGTENEEHPVAVVHGSRLFVYYQGHGGMVGMVSCGPGEGWASHGALPRAAHWPPVPVRLGERLVVLVRDYLDPRVLTAIEGGVESAVGAVASDPAAVVRGHSATVVHRSSGNVLNAVDLLGGEAWGSPVASAAEADGASLRYRDHQLRCGPARGRPRVRVTGGAGPFSFPTGDRGPRRCGGGQVVGDYLAVAVGDDVEGLVRFFDLRPLARGAAPTPLPMTVDTPGRAVAAGITSVSFGSDRRYVLAVHDGRGVAVLESTPAPLWSPECRFTPLFGAQLGESNRIALFTDRVGGVHLLAGRGEHVRHLLVDLAAEELRADRLDVRLPGLRRGGLALVAGHGREQAPGQD